MCALAYLGCANSALSTTPETLHERIARGQAGSTRAQSAYRFSQCGRRGAVAVAAAALPRMQAPAAVAVAPAEPVVDTGGYRLTEHVQRYYATARI